MRESSMLNLVANGEIKLKLNKTADGRLFRFSRPPAALFKLQFYFSRSHILKWNWNKTLKPF